MINGAMGRTGMKTVAIRNLRKDFRVKTRQPGTRAAVRSLFHPSYSTVHAVSDISFDVEEGEALAFIGPNGAGKSTTIKMLTGILYPTSGHAEVLGHVPWKERESLAYEIGSVFGQKSLLWYHLPPSDTFSLLQRIYEIPLAEYEARRKRLVDIFEIDELLSIPVRKLSLGQRMRCEIAASLLHSPRVLFLDEPTIGLDVVAKQRIRDLIHVLNKEEQVTILLTSHDLGDVEKLCKRVVVINHGQIVYDGSLRSLQQQYFGSKIIDLRLGEIADGFSCPGATVLKSKDYGIKLQVDTSQYAVGDVLTYILAHHSVVDVNIQDPPLEEIITKMYSARREDKEAQP